MSCGWKERKRKTEWKKIGYYEEIDYNFYSISGEWFTHIDFSILHSIVQLAVHTHVTFRYTHSAVAKHAQKNGGAASFVLVCMFMSMRTDGDDNFACSRVCMFSSR